MDEFKINCGFCGESNDIDKWCDGQPKDQYCCPNCKRTIRRVHGKITVMQSGYILPGKITVEEVTTHCGV